MSILSEFMGEKANKPVNTGNASFNKEGFIQKFNMVKEKVPYYFNFLWFGYTIKTHLVKDGAFYKEVLCNEYYDEECDSCKEVKVFGGEEKPNRPTRDLWSVIFVHNNNGRTKRSKKDPKKIYKVNAVSVLKTQCGEANDKLGLVKDRGIINYQKALDAGFLYDELFEIEREGKKPKMAGAVVNPKLKLSYTVDCHEGTDDPKDIELTFQDVKASDLVNQVPSDIKEQWLNQMTEGEKAGIVFSVLGNVRKDFWEARGVVFPKALEKKEKSDEDLEKEAE